MIDLIRNTLSLGEASNRTQRFTYLFRHLKIPGSIVEIGAGNGDATEIFIKTGRQVIVIDPFESGWGQIPESYGAPYSYHKFREKIGTPDNLILHQYPSQSPGVQEFLLNFKPIAFAFVDGLQFEDSVLRDLRLMEALEVGLIAIDDVHRLTDISQVPLAIEKFLANSQYIIRTSPNAREGYLFNYLGLARKCKSNNR